MDTRYNVYLRIQNSSKCVNKIKKAARCNKYITVFFLEYNEYILLWK